jgi:hypothetical protein
MVNTAMTSRRLFVLKPIQLRHPLENSFFDANIINNVAGVYITRMFYIRGYNRMWSPLDFKSI